MLRFGLIGCGKHAHWAVIPAMKATKRCVLAAVSDVSQENFRDIDDPGIHRYPDYREMLQRETLDAVYVATPCEVHCEPTVASLQAGCHVICEKPMAMTVADCLKMIQAAEANGKRLVVDFESRYIAGNMQVRQWVADGHIGAVRAVHIDHMWDGHKSFGGLAARRFGFLERNGCLDCGIHMLDLIRFFCGGGEWLDIRASGRWFGETSKFPPHIAIQARLSTGPVVTVNASFAFTAYIKARLQYHTCALVGEKGVITLEQVADGKEQFRLVSDSLSATCPLAEEGHANAISRVIEELDAVVTEGRPPSPCQATGHDGLMAQIVMDAANADAIRNGDT